MKELLFELGTEEIPARLLRRAMEALVTSFAKRLGELELAHGEVVGYATPRRLALVVSVAPAQEDRSAQQLGPPVRVAVDDAGQPTRAATGFAQRSGVAVDDLERVETIKGEYLAATVHTPGQAAVDLLPAALTACVMRLQWPKAMRWGSRRDAFIRPIHWIVALYDGAVLPLEIGGITSGAETRGHRFRAPAAFPVQDAAAWLAGLRAAHVEPDYDTRRAFIRREVEALAASVDGRALIDDALLEEVTSLVEEPVPLLGTFEARYLELPPQVLTTPMKEHQKYFPIEGADGALKNHFVVVSNLVAVDPDVVRLGNARVLRARLADAEFFFRQDLAKGLVPMVDGLAGRVFLKGLGTMRDKADRLRALAPRLVATLAEDGETLAPLADRAGFLAKADLSSEMVGEFASLQGWMGRDYARALDEDERVAQAIFEHYLPRFAGDEVPASPVGAAVALADKLDSIVGCFHLDLQPTGSADPYALRRQALGVLRILEERRPSPALAVALELTRQAFGDTIDEARWPALSERILEFFRGRLQASLATDYASDLVKAVLGVGFGDPRDARGRLDALSRLKASPGWDDLATAVKRVVKIVHGRELGPFDPATLDEPAAVALHAAYADVRDAALAALEAGDYDRALALLISLKPAIDRFFDEVLVMSDVPAERARRLGLVGEIAGLFHRVAAFDKVST